MNFKKIVSTAAMATASLGLIGAANAAVIASDNFDTYATGGVNGKGVAGSGWAGAWSGAASSTVVATTLGDAPMAGNALRFSTPADNGAAARSLSAAVSGAVWVDYLFQFDRGVMNNNDFLGMWFGTNTGPNIGLKTNCGGSPSTCTSDLFVRLSGSGGNYTTSINMGQTYHLVGLMQKTGASTSYNRFDLWVDPTNAELMSLTGIDATATGSSGLVSFSTIGFRTATLSSGDNLLVDNVGLYTSAPLKVPEPSGLALVGLGLIGASMATRRKTRL